MGRGQGSPLDSPLLSSAKALSPGSGWLTYHSVCEGALLYRLDFTQNMPTNAIKVNCNIGLVYGIDAPIGVVAHLCTRLSD